MRRCRIWAAMSAWSLSLLTWARRRYGSTTGVSGSPCPKALTTANAMKKSSGRSSLGTGLAQPSSLPLALTAGWSRLGKGEKSRILIRDHRSYWGSCSHDGTLRFNWRVVMLEPALIEYLLVHELAHLEVRNHSADFWNLVARFLPDAKQRRRRLREAGRALPF